MLRPRLPVLSRLEPYIRRIDESRIYSNWGPLVTELERRLDEPLGARVVSASSGTSALVGACLAVAGRASAERPIAVLPAFTFVATAVAVAECGYEVYLADVDAATWALDPARLVRDVDLSRVGLVVPVAPYGRPVPQDAWRAFQDETGMPVVVDAAASFELLLGDPSSYVGEIPVTLSLHATKTFSSGEGGCVLCASDELAERVMQALNFGFRDSRDSASASINGKLSEYHAAVGLAELDGWSDKQEAVRRVSESYARAFDDAGVRSQLVVWPDVASCYTLLACADGEDATSVAAALAAASIDYRFWYAGGVQKNTHFADVTHEPLPVTEQLAARLVGLPAAIDLDEPAIARIAHAVASVLAA